MVVVLCAPARLSPLLSEWAYAFFARRRGLLNRLTKLLWGPALQAERYALVSWVFLRLFGAIYVAAFASLGVQVLGLIGHAGILPVGEYFEAVHQAPGQFRVSVAAFAILDELERYRVGRGHGRRRGAGIARRRGQVDTARAHRSVRAVPLLCLRRAGFHELPVGLAAARGGVFGYISYRRIEDSRSGCTAGWSFATCFWRAS